jgi:hypothetical protein
VTLVPPERVDPRYDAALHLLDRQLVDPDGRPVGKVDDLELTEGDGALVVTAVLVGPGALGPRLGGRLGSWTLRGWQRWHGDVGAQPTRIRASDVVEIGSAVRLGRRGLGPDGLEAWLAEHLVGRLPGSGPGGRPTSSRRRPAGRGREPVGRPAPAGRAAGRPGRGVGRRPLGARQRRPARAGAGVTGVSAPLHVVGLVVSDRHAGSLLGYDRRADQGPWLVRVLVRLVHRKARYVRRADVDVDWAGPRVSADPGRAEPLGRA